MLRAEQSTATPLKKSTIDPSIKKPKFTIHTRESGAARAAELQRKYASAHA